MKISYTGETSALLGGEGLSTLDEFKMFSGMNAGICYGANGYYGTAVTDPEKALKRFSTVAKTGHHSIADHVYITALLEDCPKIVAMVLNSLNAYNTSEKSGRYTKMTGNSEKEVALYDKWLYKFSNLIKSEYSYLDDKHVKKLAMENARYLLSVFTPVTLSYTTSLRQWNYIIDWCRKFERDRQMPQNYFNNQLKIHLGELASRLSNDLYVEELRDSKDSKFEFLAYQTKSTWSEFTEKNEFFDMTYQTIYKGSFVQLAQAERHRTLGYFMKFNGESTEFFVPYILRGNTELELEWLIDIGSVSEFVPQGTLVEIIETGTVENFLLKCKERLCGRAQLEICKQTEKTLLEIHKWGDMCPMLKAKVESYMHDNEHVKSKCEILGSCKEPCEFSKAKAFTRKI